ncbi:mannose-1-phosphate guanylyltransferase [Flavimarina sp. Hel_I_48]|uniref:mannose-1-phosphate guanylyltransferase n=1 Tax=Flavimarina sp. Hel_I_48 TaxID=1392488 RepID=UPI0004DF0637|nr:mannose-1-phosphate guanylyltransferase [Flavimarina sp. Hel_I_48]
MAGGVGSRFWPLSTENFPKQFHDILGAGQTLIQKTFDRLAQLVPDENILILTNERYKTLVNEQLPMVKDSHIVLEPAMRNTAPCILLAALKIQKTNPNAIMVVAPSDHWIEDEASFSRDLDIAFNACNSSDVKKGEDDLLVTLGIKPTFPHTGYGYISYSDSDQNVKKVNAFTEKPNYETAQKFLAQGNYAWNAGIFIWCVQTIVDSFEKYLPEMYKILSGGMPVFNTNHEQTFVHEEYPKVENISIDYGILEKGKNVNVVPATFDWSDMGAWCSLYDKKEKDSDENVVINANMISKNSSGNLVRTKDGKIVVLHSLKDFVVVDREDILLIMPKEKEQEVKILRQEVKDKFGNNLV